MDSLNELGEKAVRKRTPEDIAQGESPSVREAMKGASLTIRPHVLSKYQDRPVLVHVEKVSRLGFHVIRGFIPHPRKSMGEQRRILFNRAKVYIPHTEETQ